MTHFFIFSVADWSSPHRYNKKVTADLAVPYVSSHGSLFYFHNFRVFFAFSMLLIGQAFIGKKIKP